MSAMTPVITADAADPQGQLDGKNMRFDQSRPEYFYAFQVLGRNFADRNF
jgi:hypothetical protein